MHQTEGFINGYIFSTCPNIEADKGVWFFDPPVPPPTKKNAAEWIIDLRLNVRAASKTSTNSLHALKLWGVSGHNNTSLYFDLLTDSN